MMGNTIRSSRKQESKTNENTKKNKEECSKNESKNSNSVHFKEISEIEIKSILKDNNENKAESKLEKDLKIAKKQANDRKMLRREFSRPEWNQYNWSRRLQSDLESALLKASQRKMERKKKIFESKPI